MIKCNVASWLGSRDRKQTLGENEETLNKVWTSVHYNIDTGSLVVISEANSKGN